MITFQNVSYYYPQSTTPAIEGITLYIPTGSFTLVCGASGSGKSTLLRCINGLVPHFSGGQLMGWIEVAGADPVEASPRLMSHIVGFVFQDPENQLVMDRVEDEIVFGLENAGIPREEMRSRMEWALELLGLDGLRARRVESLSGGERQRVAIASMLVLQPRILVLDEPTSQLDPASADDLINAIRDLSRLLGLTIVMSEHRLERVLPYISQVINLNVDGRDLLVGKPDEMLLHMDQVPPLIALGKSAGWRPLPLSVEASRPLAQQWLANNGGAGKTGKQDSNAVDPASLSLPQDQTPDARQPFVQIRNLEVCYGEKKALDGISLDLRRGEIVALLGDNGAGKTTLLRCLVGLIKPNQGAISIAGQEISGKQVADICRQVGYLPQNPNALLFSDTVLEEIQATLDNHQMKASDREVEDLLDELGLASLAHSYPRDLSTGQKQRVALAAIMITRPDVILLDEPTRGLDYADKERLRELLCRWRSQHKVIVLVSHDVELVAFIANRVVVLENGKIAGDGERQKILKEFPTFTPQLARLFPDQNLLTLKDLGYRQANSPKVREKTEDAPLI